MSPIPWPIAGAVVFLAGIGAWAFRITGGLDAGIGQADIALGLAVSIIAGLIAGFLWLGRKGRDRRA